MMGANKCLLCHSLPEPNCTCGPAYFRHLLRLIHFYPRHRTTRSPALEPPPATAAQPPGFPHGNGSIHGDAHRPPLSTPQHPELHPQHHPSSPHPRTAPAPAHFAPSPPPSARSAPAASRTTSSRGSSPKPHATATAPSAPIPHRREAPGILQGRGCRVRRAHRGPGAIPAAAALRPGLHPPRSGAHVALGLGLCQFLHTFHQTVQLRCVVSLHLCGLDVDRFREDAGLSPGGILSDRRGPILGAGAGYSPDTGARHSGEVIAVVLLCNVIDAWW
jgi:hypothetical protein